MSGLARTKYTLPTDWLFVVPYMAFGLRCSMYCNFIWLFFVIRCRKRLFGWERHSAFMLYLVCRLGFVLIRILWVTSLWIVYCCIKFFRRQTFVHGCIQPMDSVVWINRLREVYCFLLKKFLFLSKFDSSCCQSWVNCGCIVGEKV